MKNSLIIFFERAGADHRLRTSHISLYLALYTRWLAGGRKDRLPLDRESAMATSRILSRSCYYKRLAELSKWGYIEYQPQKWAGEKSEVRMRRVKR